MTSLREARVAEVDRHLTGAERASTGRHAAFAGTIRDSFARLRGGLARAHARCDAVDDRDWANYVVDLDRGLDEMDVEVARAAERPDTGAHVPEVLTIHVSALELSGWRLQFTVLDRSTAQHRDVQSRLAATMAELDRYRAACATGARPSADDLKRSIDELRDAAAKTQAA